MAEQKKISQLISAAQVSDYANADLITGDGAVINICGSYPIA